jgi:hypothetical protein
MEVVVPGSTVFASKNVLPHHRNVDRNHEWIIQRNVAGGFKDR